MFTAAAAANNETVDLSCRNGSSGNTAYDEHL